MINCLVVIFFLNLFILLFEKKISLFFNVYDNPDKIRKFHKNQVSLIGGFFFYLNFLLISFCNQELGLNYSLLILFSSLFFFIGFYDDIKSINANAKFFILAFIILFYLLLNEKFIISQLNIKNYQLNIYHPVNIFFTIVCFHLFINAYNMFDGINLQCFFYTNFILIILLFKSQGSDLILSLLIANLFFGFLNYKNRIFLGNSGTLLNSFIISVLIIYFYNQQLFFADEIFVIMMLPGIDMLRLFFQRILNKKNPFSPDRLHIHHLLINAYGQFHSIIVLQIITIIPYFFFHLIGYQVIFFFIIFYLFFVSFLLKKNY